MSSPSLTPMSAETQRFLLLGRLGYWGLWLLIPIWHIWLAPVSYGADQNLKPSTLSTLILLWLPLWFPMWGIITGKAYTFAWANFIVMIYFLHSLTNLWVSQGLYFWLSVIELALSCLMFYGCTYYARNRGQELGLKIPKLKDDPVRKV
ncbi:DUF2069 domain-containing protein [Alishewanella tabrizica]|uniref:Membrane protein n=1 Tax=Alishewanella tabrizica TaxID=671278 RepID=A0ABQ2WRF5_9ALTE|nr:DUF2069 domain-containing protein [Alishewanella tabrizica]GGW67883.1 membrane protein [Alishewanella tabrizica]